MVAVTDVYFMFSLLLLFLIIMHFIGSKQIDEKYNTAMTKLQWITFILTTEINESLFHAYIKQDLNVLFSSLKSTTKQHFVKKH